MAIKQLVKRALHRRDDAGKRVVACHLNELFVNVRGDVFPCCMTWGRPDLRIGSIRDADILAKIAAFRPPYCSCANFVLRRAGAGEGPAYRRLNLELSLACQASCAMCCVGAPDWRGTYDLYDRLTPLVEHCAPSIELLVQGGEVLVQRESLRWLRTLRERLPRLRIGLVTNGNVPEDVADVVEELCYRATVSVVGFQPQTYERIMGLRVERLRRFAERLVAGGRTRVFLKYLTTPLGAHEVPLFLEWALSLQPRMIQLVDADTPRYLAATPDRFWEKILERTGRATRELLAARGAELHPERCLIFADPNNRRHLGLTAAFLREQALERVVLPFETFDDAWLLGC